MIFLRVVGTKMYIGLAVRGRSQLALTVPCQGYRGRPPEVRVRSNLSRCARDPMPVPAETILAPVQRTCPAGSFPGSEDLLDDPA